MTPSSSDNIYLTGALSTFQPSHWQIERKLGTKWVSPDRKDCSYVMLEFKFSLNPPEEFFVPKIELELEIEGDKEEDILEIDYLSPQLEEEFDLQPVIWSKPENKKIWIELRIPGIKLSMNFSCSSVPKLKSVLKKKHKKRIAIWYFNSGCFEGTYYVRIILGVPYRTSIILAKLLLRAEFAYKFYPLRIVLKNKKIMINENYLLSI